ncbi:MAG: SH3 domain-containing protein [Anaerolineales bacterium]
MDSHSDINESKLSREERIRNLRAMGVSEVDAVNIIDRPSKISLWSNISRYISDFPLVTLCISILALGIACFSIYLTRNYLGTTTNLNSQISTLQSQLQSQQQKISQLPISYLTPPPNPTQNNLPKASGTPLSEFTSTSSPTSTQTIIYSIASITEDFNATVYSEPSASATKVGTLLKGTVIQVLARSDDNSWVAVWDKKETYGWVLTNRIVMLGGTLNSLPLTPMPTIAITP